MTVSRKTLQIKGFSRQISFNAGERLLDIFNANKVGISQSCDGNGSCTTCRVIILKGLENCSPRTEIEAERAHERSFENNERLSCQTAAADDLTVEIVNLEELTNN